MKVHGGSERCGPKWVVISTNECFLKHKLDSKVVFATHMVRRGIKKDSTNDRDWEEHDRAIRMRILEVRLFNRPKLDDFTIHAPQDPVICRMGLFAVLLKQLARSVGPIRCKSHYFLPMVFHSLKQFAREFSHFGQNQLPPAKFEKMLLKKIEEVQDAVSPPLPLPGGDDDDGGNILEVESAGMSILEDRKDAMYAAAADQLLLEEERRKRRDGGENFWPLFRKRALDTEGDDNQHAAAAITSTPAKRARREESDNDNDAAELSAIETFNGDIGTTMNSDCVEGGEDEDEGVDVSGAEEISTTPLCNSSLVNRAYHDFESFDDLITV